MRLIDADAFEANMQNEWERNEISNGEWIHFREMINAEPTIEPERTGEWIDYSEDGYVECPFCHSATNCDDNIDELHFCFSCGAKMEEPEDIPMEYFESGGR